MNQTGVITCAKSADKFSCHERSGGYPDAKDQAGLLSLWHTDVQSAYRILKWRLLG